MKTCIRCGSLRRKNSHYCPTCNKEYQKGHYQRNKEEYKKKAREYKLAVKKKLHGFMSKHACVDCGECRVPALQLDHVRGKKDRAIAKMVTDNCSWERILLEIEKCEVRCANCHAVKTAKEQGWYSWLTAAVD